MEDLRKKNAVDAGDKEIVFSKSVKAGKRIYYLDVKKNRKDELFLAITESKKIVSGEGEDSQISFEKHKIFLYKEDFEKFMKGLEETIAFINRRQDFVMAEGCASDGKEDENLEKIQAHVPELEKISNEIKIDIEF